MIGLNLIPQRGSRLRVLCLGAHSDDIEIGCGGTILRLAEQYPDCEFQWVVFSASGVRGAEAQRAAELFAGSRITRTLLKDFRDGFMPWTGVDVKDFFEQEVRHYSPDLIFTHRGEDAHQDHRLISQLTWNTFRDHFILEYEIPKYDGDLGRPGVYLPLNKTHCETKVRYLMEAFNSQRSKHWFEPEMFTSLMRLRGMECASPSGYAEAFYCRKMILCGTP